MTEYKVQLHLDVKKYKTLPRHFIFRATEPEFDDLEQVYFIDTESHFQGIRKVCLLKTNGVTATYVAFYE